MRKRLLPKEGGPILPNQISSKVALKLIRSLKTIPNLVSKMERIISNPGLQHLAEKVFFNLDDESLKNCGQINQSCKQILKNPMFWLKKFRSLTKENLKDWIKVIKPVKNSDKQNAI